jgi:hypothetical protein
MESAPPHPPPDSSEPADPLVSVEDVARTWQVATATVVALVAEGKIPSLDGGRLVRRGRMDVPCLRRSWAESLRVDSPGAVRRIDDPHSGVFHPAAAVALDFHVAVQDGNGKVVYDLSSAASRAAAPDDLLEAWRAALGDAAGPNVSLTSGVYRLHPYPGVGVRVIHGTAPIPIRVDKPTATWMAGMIPLIEEEGAWRANLELARLGVNWSRFLTTPPPE